MLRNVNNKQVAVFITAAVVPGGFVALALYKLQQYLRPDST